MAYRYAIGHLLRVRASALALRGPILICHFRMSVLKYPEVIRVENCRSHSAPDRHRPLLLANPRMVGGRATGAAQRRSILATGDGVLGAGRTFSFRQLCLKRTREPACAVATD